MVTISRDKIWKQIKKIINSLWIRIFLAALVFGIIPCLVLQQTILSNYEEKNIALLTSNVQNQSQILANQLLMGRYLDNPNSESINAEIAQIANAYNGRILVINRGLKVVKDSYGLDAGKSLVSGEAVRALKGEGITEYNPDGRYIEITVPLTRENESSPVGAIILSVSTGTTEDIAQGQSRRSWIVILGIFGVLVILGALTAELLSRPIRKWGETLESSIETYDMPMGDIHTYSENEGIVVSIEKTLSRMRALDESRQEFVSNVSHELKTPITSMKVLADSLVGQENIPIEIYQEFMEDITQEIDRESEIINELLSLVRLDKKAALHIESTNVNSMVEMIMKRLRPIAEAGGIELIMESYRPVFAEIDEGKLGLAFSNLIENAVKYNVEHGWVKVTLESDHKNMFLAVADSGPGIPKEEQEHIFERFYRGDKSHSTEIKGTGLGLAITRNAVALHHGSIDLESEPGQGSKFTVRIPLHYDG